MRARHGWEGLSPKENREIPPLDYDRVYRLKQKYPEKFIGINGGIGSLNEAIGHLAHVDGVMLGRAVYHTPSCLAEVDARLYGETVGPVDWERLVETMCGYAAAHIARGGRLGHITRHMVGLFHGQPGARRFRQILSTEAARPGAGPDVLRAAMAAIRAEEARAA
jgi:tRNA-dihydrouridine synthase A